MRLNTAITTITSTLLLLSVADAYTVQCYTEEDCSGDYGPLETYDDQECLDVIGRKSCMFNQASGQGGPFMVVGGSVEQWCGGYDVRGSCATGNACVNLQHPYGEYPDYALVGKAPMTLCYAG